MNYSIIYYRCQLWGITPQPTDFHPCTRRLGQKFVRRPVFFSWLTNRINLSTCKNTVQGVGVSRGQFYTTIRKIVSATSIAELYLSIFNRRFSTTDFCQIKISAFMLPKISGMRNAQFWHPQPVFRYKFHNLMDSSGVSTLHLSKKCNPKKCPDKEAEARKLGQTTISPTRA